MACEDLTSVEENETPFIRVWKPLSSKCILKTSRGSLKGKAQRGQYLLAVSLGRYMGSHNPPPSGPSVLADTRSHLQSMWDPPIHFLWDPTSFLAYCLVSTPFWGSASRWHIVWCLTLIPFVTAKATASRYCSLPFGLPFKFFKTRLLRKSFHTLITLIKNASLETN